MKSLQILAKRHLLVSNKQEAVDNYQYYNAFLLANFGIIVDKPKLLAQEHLKLLTDIFKLSVPNSFYNNPQDLRYYTRHELLVEQFISYVLVETVGFYDRIDLFKKELPEYVVGDELKLREFKILTETEAEASLKEIFNAYCSYTRPFSIEELEEFNYLFDMLYTDQFISCKDNIISMLPKKVSLAKMLDKKDLVKMSIKYFGEHSNFGDGKAVVNTEKFALIQCCLPLVRDCPLSKKQAKYYNKLVKLGNANLKLEDNSKSPYKQINSYLKNGDVLGAANICAANGSLLERNLVNLISKANMMQAFQIIDMLPAKNPIALYQIVSGLTTCDDKRTFIFTKNGKVRKHIETDYEHQWRKSKLNPANKNLLLSHVKDKLLTYYTSLPKLGNIYINDKFYKIALPTNTSSNGKGIDILPTGSRIPLTKDNLRTFVYWNNAFDIDASLILIDAAGMIKTLNFVNYTAKPFGDNILFSGDDRGCDGAEYFDIKLKNLKELGYTKIIQYFYGYGSRLDRGNIYTGYQEKDNLETTAWDPKNISMQFRVQGDSRCCAAFGIDLDTMELVVLNQILDNESRVLETKDLNFITRYFEAGFLDINLGLIFKQRGNIVNDITKADFILDDDYKPLEYQTVIRSWELEKLVNYLN